MKVPAFTTKQLFGRWRTRQAAYSCDWLLRADGTFMADISEHGVTISRPIGTGAFRAMSWFRFTMKTSLISSVAARETETDYWRSRTTILYSRPVKVSDDVMIVLKRETPSNRAFWRTITSIGALGRLLTAEREIVMLLEAHMRKLTVAEQIV